MIVSRGSWYFGPGNQLLPTLVLACKITLFYCRILGGARAVAFIRLPRFNTLSMNTVVLLAPLISLFRGAYCVINGLVLDDALSFLAWLDRGLLLRLWQLIVPELD